MEHQDICKAILHIRPNAEFSLSGLDINWTDKTQTQPTFEEIEAGWAAYKLKELSEAKALAKQKAELLDRLGITADEAALLLS